MNYNDIVLFEPFKSCHAITFYPQSIYIKGMHIYEKKSVIYAV